jgi:N-methylhydantoinase B
VESGFVSQAIAGRVYGVVMTHGVVDADATTGARADIRTTRLREATPVTEPAPTDSLVTDGEVLHPVTDTIEAVNREGTVSLRCTECSHRYCDYTSDFKLAAVSRDMPLTSVSELNATGLVDEIILREFYCPGCGTMVAMDVQRKSEPVLPECHFIVASE